MKNVKTYRSALMAAAMMFGSTAAWAQFPRTVLIEEFTSVTCVNCPLATQAINAILKAKGDRVASIRYHLNYPVKGDPWYAANPQQNEARRTFYNVPALPYGKVGGLSATVTDQGMLEDQVNDQLQMESPVQVTVTQALNGNQYNVLVKVKAGENGLESETYHLRTVVVEHHIHDESVKQIAANNGEVEFGDVMRSMLPGPDGTEFTLGPNETKEFPFTVPVGSGWQPDQIYTIAFVQSGSTSDIVQTGFSPRPAEAGVEEIAMAGYWLEQSAPNPARDEATIGYAVGGRQHVVIDLYNAAGQKVTTLDEGNREAGSYQTRLSLAGLPAGAYIYTIRAGAFHASRGLTVVK
jgi:hypothetical protein